MPGKDVLEATRRIRELPDRRGKIRIVAVTAQTFAQQIEMCRQAGKGGYVSEPLRQVVMLVAKDAVWI